MCDKNGRRRPRHHNEPESSHKNSFWVNAGKIVALAIPILYANELFFVVAQEGKPIPIRELGFSVFITITTIMFALCACIVKCASVLRFAKAAALILGGCFLWTSTVGFICEISLGVYPYDWLDNDLFLALVFIFYFLMVRVRIRLLRPET